MLQNCNTKSVLESYYSKKDEILQQQNDKDIYFEDLVRTYVESENRL